METHVLELAGHAFKGVFGTDAESFFRHLIHPQHFGGVGFEDTSGGGGVTPTEDCLPSEMVGQGVISDDCKGAIAGLTAAGDKTPVSDAIKLGLYRPDQIAESAVIPDGTKFERFADGSIKVVTPDGRVLASVDCHGKVIKYDGPYMDSEPCDKTAQVVAEAKKVEEPDYTLPKVQMVKVLVDCPDGSTIETVAAVEPDEQGATRFLEGQPARTMAYYPGSDGMLHVKYVGLSGKIHDMVVCDNGKDVTVAESGAYLKSHTRPIE